MIHFISYVQCVSVCVCTHVEKTWHLDTDAALQFELQTDHVHLTGGAELFDLSYLLAHLIDGHLDGAQISVVLIHHCNTLLYVGETMCGCGTETG